jgi:3'-phosphoadenosine 5'-phosphosulfate sulfotransferase (PAPS reductase)/FAD synthetase
VEKGARTLKHIANVSFGKDSLAMLLLLIEKQYPLDEVVFYDTGKEFQAIYNLRDRIKPLLEGKGIKFTEVYPPKPFDFMMFEHKTKSGKTGYGWCGGCCRWGTSYKIAALDKICSIKNDVQYIGIAADEPKRLIKKRTGNRVFPLAEWGTSERDCLEYCHSKGFDWNENGIELYSIFDRVSCWCCRNKNLNELRNMYLYLPDYWERLKEIQSRLPEPMKNYKNKKYGEYGNVFDLEKVFNLEKGETK